METVKAVYGNIYFPVEKFRKVQDKIENRFVSCDKFQGHRKLWGRYYAGPLHI